MEARTPAPGELITEDGLYNIDMPTYHGQPTDGPSISSSGLRTIWSQSPAHFWMTSPLNPDRVIDDKERPHFSIGRAAHHLLFLGRKGFDAEYVTRPAKWADWRTNDSKAWKADALAAGLTILTETELDLIAGMARSLAAHPMVKAGILDGEVERSMIWRDEETGVWLKSRPDNIIIDSADMSDLKTTVSVSDDAIQRTLAEFHYPMQGALVGKGTKAVLGVEMESFSLVFVEKAPPHCVRVVALSSEDLVRGTMQVDAMTEVFARCVVTNHWPGPGGDQSDAETVAMPSWATKRIDDRLELLKQTNP